MGREERCKQISLTCVWSARSVWTTLGLPLITACVLSRSTLLRLQVALQGCSAEQALHFVHSSGLSCSGSCSWVLHKGTDLVGHVSCALPRPEELRWPGAWRKHCPRWAVHLSHLPGPSCSVSWVRQESAISRVPCVLSGELISGCNPPGRCQPSRIPRRLG